MGIQATSRPMVLTEDVPERVGSHVGRWPASCPRFGRRQTGSTLASGRGDGVMQEDQSGSENQQPEYVGPWRRRQPTTPDRRPKPAMRGRPAEAGPGQPGDTAPLAGSRGPSDLPSPAAGQPGGPRRGPGLARTRPARRVRPARSGQPGGYGQPGHGQPGGYGQPGYGQPGGYGQRRRLAGQHGAATASSPVTASPAGTARLDTASPAERPAGLRPATARPKATPATASPGVTASPAATASPPTTSSSSRAGAARPRASSSTSWWRRWPPGSAPGRWPTLDHARRRPRRTRRARPANPGNNSGNGFNPGSGGSARRQRRAPATRTPG